MPELDDILARMNGNSSVEFSAAIVRCQNGELVVMSTDPEDIFEAAFDGVFLEDSIYDKESLSKISIIPGIYEVKMKYSSFRCNHPLDPEEWDSELTILEVEPFAQLQPNQN